MQSISINSRIIRNVYFNQEDGQLHICFKNGEERLFIGVPQREVEAMCRSKSPGQHYIDRIREHYKRLAA